MHVPRIVIGLVLSLLLPTLITWFSLDHKRNVSDGIVSGIGMLFSLDHKRYTSDYDSDSDSVASENQPLVLSLEANVSFGSAEFISRRLHGFERKLNVLSSRSRVSFQTEVQLLSDLHALLHIVSQQRQCCEDLFYLGFHEEEEEQHSTGGMGVVISGCPGHPRLVI